MQNLNSNETILRRERLHKGIFWLPALVFLVPLIPIAALGYFLSIIHQKMNEAFQSLPGQQNPSGLIYLPMLLFIVPWLLVCLVFFLSVLFAFLKSEIILTNQRLLFRTGFIMRVSGELPLENIEAIFLIEPFFGRIFGYGTINLTSIGGANFPLHYLASTQEFHARLQRAVAAAKRAPIRTLPTAPPEPLAPPADEDSRFRPKGLEPPPAQIKR